MEGLSYQTDKWHTSFRLSSFSLISYFHFKKKNEEKNANEQRCYFSAHLILRSTQLIEYASREEENNHLHCCARVERRISKASNFLILSFKPAAAERRGRMRTKIKLSSLMRRDKFNVLLLNYFGLAIHSAPLSFVRRSMAWNFLKNHIIYPFFFFLFSTSSSQILSHSSSFAIYESMMKIENDEKEKKDSIRFVELRWKYHRVPESVSVSPSGMNEAKRISKLKQNEKKSIASYRRLLASL